MAVTDEGGWAEVVRASAAVLHEMLDGLADLLYRSADEAMAWNPQGEAMNSTSVLVAHMAGSLQAWLSRAAGVPFARDRDAEFAARLTAKELGERVATLRARVDELLDAVGRVDPASLRPFRRLDRPVPEELSVAWCLQHALIHAGEHWGQILLNDSLYRARLAGGD